MIDLDRYLRLLRTGSLAAYDDTKQGGAQIYAIACAALEGWGQAQDELAKLRAHAQHHAHGCAWLRSFGALACDCGLEP